MKVSLDSKQDLLYIKNLILQESKKELENYSKEILEISEARTTQDKPKSSAHHVEQELQGRISKWVDLIFQLASPNILINGMDYEEAMKQEEYEPVDEDLCRETERLQYELLEKRLALGELKKQIPFKLKDEMMEQKLEFKAETVPVQQLLVQVDEQLMTRAATEFQQAVETEMDLKMKIPSKLDKIVRANDLLSL